MNAKQYNKICSLDGIVERCLTLWFCKTKCAGARLPYTVTVSGHDKLLNAYLLNGFGWCLPDSGFIKAEEIK